MDRAVLPNSAIAVMGTRSQVDMVISPNTRIFKST